jgi:hypothetical protein
MASPNEEGHVRPLQLTKMAESISRSYGDKGAIIITSGDDGIRVGVHGLDLNEAKDALCVAISDVVSRSLAWEPKGDGGKVKK